MALQKTLLKKSLKYRHPLPPKTSFCDKTIGSRELIFRPTYLEVYEPPCIFSATPETVEWEPLSHLTWKDYQHVALTFLHNILYRKLMSNCKTIGCCYLFRLP